MSESNQPMIHIHMLGGFELQVEDKLISDSISHTRQLWNLLEYLIAYRHKSITQQELIEALWPNNNSENPTNALKNLVYRIRTVFTQHNIPYAKELIRFSHGSYCWNNDLSCAVDTEEFERLSREARTDCEPSLRAEKYMKALSFYKGDFLPNSCYEQWVAPLAAYYRTLYFKCVYETSLLLMDLKRYGDLGRICQKAIKIDPFEERAHKYLIYSLIKQDKQTQALDHYNEVTELFYRELGVRPSESMRGLYREITKSVKSVEADLDVIKEDLREGSMVEHAFYCDYEVFKNLYRIEARSATRKGQSIFIGLFTVTDRNNNVPEPKALSVIMDQLLNSIRRSLRKGDVVSRFSSTQFVLMLPTVTYENGQMVLERICKKFRASYHNKNVKLHTNLQPIDPIP